MRTGGQPRQGYRVVGRLDPEAEEQLGDDELNLLYERTSLSGHERNHLFLSRRGRAFTDLSALSGLDHPGDSRAFALLDFDRDGWLDLAVTGANAPALQLFRNRIGEGRSGPPPVIAVRFEGANRAAAPAPDSSHRDGYGATVSVGSGELKLLREHRAGEGFAAQNSATLLIGLGAAGPGDSGGADTLAVRWPSGRVQETAGIPAGTLVTAWENPSHSPTGEAFTFEPYAVSPAPRPAARHPKARLQLAERLATGSRLQIFTTMATWCQACRRELPQLRRLRATFDATDLELFGVPIDPEDDRPKLEAYVAEHDPAYRLLLDLDPAEIAEVETTILEQLHHDALPSTLITDGEGRILRVQPGVPTISDLRRWLRILVPEGPR